MNRSLAPAPRRSSPVETLLSSLLRRVSVYGMQRRWLEARFRRAGLTQRTAEIDGCLLRFWVGGEGRPLLMLHGFGGDATLTWGGQVGALARRHRLVVPDLLWFGQSTSRVADFSVAFQARIFTRLLDTLDVGDLSVMGISYGGLVAFTLAHELPRRVERLVMVASPGPAYHRDDHEAALSRFGVDDLAGVILPEDASGVRRLVELAWYRPPPTPSFVLEDVYRHVFTQRVDEKRRLLAAIQDTRESLARRGWVVDQPTLLVWGDHDPLFPLHVGLRLEQMLPRSRLVVLPGTRHAPHIERRRRFNAAVLTFMDGS